MDLESAFAIGEAGLIGLLFNFPRRFISRPHGPLMAAGWFGLDELATGFCGLSEL
jgi:hypothetical protein